jgi:predicted GTPase
MWEVMVEVLRAVAQHFRPGEREPALEIAVPDLLLTAELVARDLRQALAEHVPGAHVLTLGDLKRLRRWAGVGQRLYGVYRTFLRVVRFGANPVAAVLSEVRDAAAGDLYHASTGEVKRFAVGYAVRKAGYYAIQLYSGQLVDDETLDAYHTRRSREDARRAETFDQRTSQEPLRILVLGQVKAGKSSLINALFGQTRAAVDLVPRTRGIEPFVLEREGIPRALVFDTAGYDDRPGGPSPFSDVKDHVLQSDVVIVVCSACGASRAPDRRLLEDLRALFAAEPDRVAPPVVVALTHIDQLRPLAEWSPPYDLANPAGTKAELIRDAMRAVETDLGLAPGQVVVPVCLAPDRLYNVEEGLAPAILNVMPEAQRVRYLRCLRSFHDDDYWQRLWRQALNSGRVLLRAGAAWMGKGR